MDSKVFRSSSENWAYFITSSVPDLNNDSASFRIFSSFSLANASGLKSAFCNVPDKSSPAADFTNHDLNLSPKETPSADLASASIIFCTAFLYSSAASSIVDAALARCKSPMMKVSLFILKSLSASAASFTETPMLSMASLFSKMNFFCASISPPNRFHPCDKRSNVDMTVPEVSPTFF